MTSARAIVAFLSICFPVTFLLGVDETRAQTGVPPSSIPDTTKRNAQSPSGVDFRWEEGLHLGYHYKDIFNLELGGRLQVDGGYIAANHGLQIAYPTLQGWNVVLRSARVSLVGTFYQTVKAEVEVEFAQTREFKNAWVGSAKKIPVIGDVKAGNMKEPFSLETLTGSGDVTFMESSLPTVAFSPSYNLGLKFNNIALNE